jgi:D-amino-acid dehydrogenase
MHIGIIGGGIIGLSTAYFLNKEGHQVTILDQGDLKVGCSTGNAGMIVPSHFIPLAAPGMMAKGLRWMFNSKSPFYVRPRLSGDLIKWGYQFYKHSTKQHVEQSIPALKEISLLSKVLYQKWANELPFDFGYHEKGLLMLYKLASVEHEEMETAALANKIGIEAHVLNAKEVQDLEPDVKVSVKGGVYFPGDAHLTPGKLFAGMVDHLSTLGTKMVTHCEVTSFETSSNKVNQIITNKGAFTFDEIVIATGSWSGGVMKKLQLALPMQAGKGYSFTLPNMKKNVHIPSIFLEARVAVTPMGSDLRFGGTMEIVGVDHSINMNRVKGIVDSIPNYYPEMDVQMPSVNELWHGLRPCSPDGLPYIGRLKNITNVIVATGHSMMGLSLAPGTGKLTAELVNRKKTSMRLDAFAVERFGK